MYSLNIGGESFEFDVDTEYGQKKLIEKLLIAYRKKFPFFINLLISLCDIKPIEKEESGLAYTKLNINSERIDIYINFSIIEKNNFSHESVLFLIFHELLHNYLYHFARFDKEMKDGNGQIVNIVTDYYVNEMCAELIGKNTINEFYKKKMEIIIYDSITKICETNNIEGLPEQQELRNKWTERTLYNFLAKNLPTITMEQMGNGSDIDNHNKSNETSKNEKTNGNGEKGSGDKGQIDDSAIKDVFINKIKAVEQEIQSYGYSQNESEAISRKAFLTKPNYFLNVLKLKRIITNALKGDKTKTYSKVNRRKVVGNIVYKGKKITNGYKLVVGIDVSGSISDDDLVTFMNMLLGLNKKKQDVLFDIIFWSSGQVIKGEHAFKDVTDIKTFFSKVNVKSYGGTMVETFHQYLNENYKEPIEVINITDGEFSFDKKLNNNILKYHFVLTEKVPNAFTDYYSSETFEVVSIKQQSHI